MKFPKIIGHRGLKDLYPENTIQSILAAYELGLDWVEVDVKISKDKTPFLLHDDTLERTTTGNGLANSLNYSDIQKLDAGYFFYKKKTDIYPPTLKEVLRLCKNKKKSINIELKPNKGLERLNTKEIINITNSFKEISIYFSSFDLKSCIEVMNLNPFSYCGLLVDNFEDYTIEEIISISKKNNFYGCGLNLNIISKEIINELKENNLIVFVYSEKNITFSKAKNLWDNGVNCIFSDDPTEILNNI